MSNPDSTVIVRNLSKSYRLGKSDYKMLGADVRRWWARVRGREDPLAQIQEGEADARAKDGQSSSDEFIALDDVSFEVGQGDALGVIGTNGAGKSTLLKVISRVTLPSAGEVELHGRVLSMLEVGTGFHPDLSGRENVYLNGLILGMSRREIKRKFDEIVEFSEVERFIDTPVKRYSSGMQVRLGFSVAAHFEPEILIIDEVLAVGDAKFQKKCLDKMQGVIRDGRTILFVSHNINAVSTLCNKGLVLQQGRLRYFGEASKAISVYGEITNKVEAAPGATFDPGALGRHVGDEYAHLENAEIRDCEGRVSGEVRILEDLAIRMEFAVSERRSGVPIPGFSLFRYDGTCAFSGIAPASSALEPGRYVAECRIPGNLLNEGIHHVSLWLSSRSPSGVATHFSESRALEFRIVDTESGGGFRDAGIQVVPGVVRPTNLLKWEFHRAR